MRALTGRDLRQAGVPEALKANTPKTRTQPIKDWARTGTANWDRAMTHWPATHGPPTHWSQTPGAKTHTTKALRLAILVPFALAPLGLASADSSAMASTVPAVVHPFTRAGSVYTPT